MTNECYSIDNPLKAYSKSNVKTDGQNGLSPSTVFKNKDFDHLRYSNNLNEKKIIHNKPVSLHNSPNNDIYRGYHRLMQSGSLGEELESTEDNMYTNWNLYGGCDIETTPEAFKYHHVSRNLKIQIQNNKH